MNMRFWKFKSTHTVEVWPDPSNQNLHPKLTERETLYITICNPLIKYLIWFSSFSLSLTLTQHKVRIP